MMHLLLATSMFCPGEHFCYWVLHWRCVCFTLEADTFVLETNQFKILV